MNLPLSIGCSIKTTAIANTTLLLNLQTGINTIPKIE